MTLQMSRPLPPRRSAAAMPYERFDLSRALASQSGSSSSKGDWRYSQRCSENVQLGPYRSISPPSQVGTASRRFTSCDARRSPPLPRCQPPEPPANQGHALPVRLCNSLTRRSGRPLAIPAGFPGIRQTLSLIPTCFFPLPLSSIWVTIDPILQDALCGLTECPREFHRICGVVRLK